MERQPHEYLGLKAEDKITGFKGVITEVLNSMYGCLQVNIKPTELREGKAQDSDTFDLPQVTINFDDPPVMTTPEFPTSFEIQNGDEIEDPITGLKGIAVSRAFLINGCTMINMARKHEVGKAELAKNVWFHETRIIKIAPKPEPVKPNANKTGGWNMTEGSEKL